MTRTWFWRYLVAVGLLALVYFGAAKLTVLTAFGLNEISPVWLPVGISQAALLLQGQYLWPGVALGELFYARSLGISWIVACTLALSSTLQPLLGTWLLRQIGCRLELDRLRDVLGLVTLSGLLSTAVANTMRLLSLYLIGNFEWSEFVNTWFTGWLGDVMAILMITPVLLTWAMRPQLRYKPWRMLEGVIWLTLLLDTSWLVFGSRTKAVIANYPLEYLPFPLMIWAAFRFGQRGTALANLLVSSIAIGWAAQGEGPFLKQASEPQAALLFLQVFIGVISTTTLVLAATVIERHHAENSLRESEASLANAQRIAHLGSWDFDLVKQRLFWSDELYRILGFAPSAFEPTLEHFLKSIHPEDQEWVQQLIDHALSENQPFITDFRIVLPDGSERIVHGTCEVIQTQEGGAETRAERLTGTIQDITKQKLIERALLQSESQLLELAHNLDQKVTERTQQLQAKNLELAESLRTLTETQQQLIQSEKMSSLGQLVAGMAHEINNPINFIYGNLTYTSNYIRDILKVLHLYRQYYPTPIPEIQSYSDIIDLDFVIEDLPKVLSSMRTGTERIRQIIVSLRNFSRLDESDMKLVDIHEGIESTLLILQSRLKGRAGSFGMEVVKEYGNLPLVECYPGQLNQVFLNLLANAIDALEDKRISSQHSGVDHSIEGTDNRLLCADDFMPQITIRTQLIESTTVQIEIADNGLGMNEAVRSRIFDPFFTTKAVGKGTGLGLSICFSIIAEKHQGQLKCFSEPGKGATFQLEIPLRQSC